jgi:hypothetical protein
MGYPLNIFKSIKAGDLEAFWAAVDTAEWNKCSRKWHKKYLCFAHFFYGEWILPREFEDSRTMRLAGMEAAGRIIRLAEKKPFPALEAFLRSITPDEWQGAIQDLSMEISDKDCEKQCAHCPAIDAVRFAWEAACDEKGEESDEALVLDYVIKLLWLFVIIAQGREALVEGANK